MNAFDLTVEALRQQGLNSDEILEKLSKLFNEMSCKVEESDSEETEETRIRGLLKTIGVPSHLKGYECWVFAIQIYKKNKKNKKKTMTKEIYPQVAENFGVTPAAAERRMRIAVGKAIERCPAEIMEAVFGNSLSYKKNRLTNWEFLTALAEQI